MFVLPLEAEELNPYTFETQLDGSVYGFGVYYLERTESYYLDVFTLDGESIARGIRVVCDVNLLGKYRLAQAPPGLLVARSLVAGDDSPPTAGELGLGARVQIVYHTPEELAQSAAAETLRVVEVS